MARSDNWRINKSSIMAVEGAHILKALQKVAGAAGLPKDFKVTFATQAHGSGVDFDTHEVVIGAGRLFKEAPIIPDLFDVLVGLTLHEVGHEQISTDKVLKSLERHAEGRSAPSIGTSLADTEREIFQRFVNIGEDIVIESRTRANPNLKEYDEALHKWAVAQLREADTNKLMEVWIEYALGHESIGILNLPAELVQPMQQLVALTGWLREQPDYRDRFTSYLRYWAEVKDAILNPVKPQSNETTKDGDNSSSEKVPTPTSDKPETEPEPEPEPPEPPKPDESEPPSDSGAEPNASHEPDKNNKDDAGTSEEDASAPEPENGSNGEGEEDEMERPLAPSSEDAIDDKLADEINGAIVAESEDVTEEVIMAFQEHGQTGVRMPPIIRSRETRTPLVKPNPQLCKRLQRIMTIRKRLQARVMHGEQYGRIDKLHLSRIATDQRIFSLRYKFPDGFPSTRILIDLSGSMSGKQANEVLEAAGALQTLVNAQVWCYNRNDGRTNLVRMDEGKLIRTFVPDGATPSGEAIVGVSLGMKKGGLIIHLTDGGHNAGQPPWTAHWILQKKGIDLVNLIWGGSSRTRHYMFDGLKCQDLDCLADFPDALYRILVEQVQLSRMGGDR